MESEHNALTGLTDRGQWKRLFCIIRWSDGSISVEPCLYWLGGLCMNFGPCQTSLRCFTDHTVEGHDYAGYMQVLFWYETKEEAEKVLEIISKGIGKVK